MTKIISRYRFLWLVVLALGAGTAHAQLGQEYQPRVGQAGKDVVWVPTPDDLVERMLTMAKVTASDFVIDLGSGDGRTVIMAAKRGARAHGVEYNPDMVEISKRNAANERLSDRATFAKEDLFTSDFSQATVITMFLLPQINLKLRPKLLDLKPGTRIVSNSFTMGEWQEDDSVTATDDCSGWCTALLWIVPAKVEGVWRLPEGELTIKQSYQFFTGSLKSGSNVVALSNGKLKGEQIFFNAGGALYVGKVSSNSMAGTISSGGAWQASQVK